MRKKILFLEKECLKELSEETINSLSTKYELTSYENGTNNPNVKVVNEKPPAFATLRKKSICFTGDVGALRTKLLMRKEKDIAFDFDGVIHSYTSKWISADIIPDPPVQGMIELLRDCQKFYNVAIYSSRCNTQNGIDAMKKFFETYDIEIGTYLETLPDNYLLIDDRAIDYSRINDIVLYLTTFDSWTKKR